MSHFGNSEYPKILGFLGRAGSGKSTAAKYMAHVYGARIFSFATPLKLLAQKLWGFTDEQVFGSQAQKEEVIPALGYSPREAMVRLGNGARNFLESDIWIRACFNAIAKDFSESREAQPLYIIDDVRFENEARAIKFGGGAIVKLVCPNTISTADPEAETEKEVDEVSAEYIDAVIDCERSEDSRDLLHMLDLWVKKLRIC